MMSDLFLIPNLVRQNVVTIKDGLLSAGIRRGPYFSTDAYVHMLRLFLVDFEAQRGEKHRFLVQFLST